MAFFEIMAGAQWHLRKVREVAPAIPWHPFRPLLQYPRYRPSRRFHLLAGVKRHANDTSIRIRRILVVGEPVLQTLLVFDGAVPPTPIVFTSAGAVGTSNTITVSMISLSASFGCPKT
jgi:hypothetical protein